MGWDEWGNHILAELKRLHDAVERLESITHREHKKIAANISSLNAKAGLLGAAGGIAVTVVTKWLLK
jgi:hypothetical protein